MKGVKVPPPPRPPTLAKKVIVIKTRIPTISDGDGGKTSSFIINYPSYAVLFVEFSNNDIYI